MCCGLKSDNVTLVGKHQSKMAKAIGNNNERILLRNISGNLHRHFDVVIEASGSESGFTTALDLLKPRGKLVLKSTFHGKPAWEASRIVVDEITIIGSRCGRFSPAIDLLVNRRIMVDQLIDEEFSLRDGMKAIDKAGKNGVLKVLLNVG